MWHFEILFVLGGDHRFSYLDELQARSVFTQQSSTTDRVIARAQVSEPELRSGSSAQ
jgi:hypothetical protein